MLTPTELSPGTPRTTARFLFMTGMMPNHIPQMRILAARLRAQAVDTHVALYQRKFETLASELEEAAEEAESRQSFHTIRLAS